MSRQLVGIGSFVAVLALSSPASAAPAWCATEGATSVSANADDLASGIKDNDAREVVRAIVGITCGGGDASAQKATWSTRLGMIETDWADAAVWASAEQSERMQNIVEIDLQGQKLGIGDSLKRAWSSFGPFDQYAAISRGMGNDSLARDKHYLTDAFGPNLSEIGRLAYIEACLATTDAQIVRWAMCSGDIAALDRKKLATEIRADKSRSHYDRMAIRIRLDRMNQALGKHTADVKAAMAKDPAYAKMFELAATTRTEWSDRWKTDAALVALAASLDDARSKDSKKGYGGCEEPTQKAFDAAVALVSGAPLAGAEDGVQNPFVTQAMSAVVATPSGYLAGVAYYLCRSRAGADPDLVTRSLGGAMARWPGHRGPRSATYTAILTAGLELDTSSDTIDYPAVSRAVFDGRGTRATSGTIAKLTRDGDSVTITWNTQLKKEERCGDMRTSNRIVAIQWDGTLVYQSTCMKYKTVTVDVTPEPETVHARYATGLTVGMKALATEKTVIAAWKKGAKAPSMLVGVAVK